MGLFVNLRLKAGRMMLYRRLAALRRMKQDFNLDRVRKIGILWDASFENDFQYLDAVVGHVLKFMVSTVVTPAAILFGSNCKI